MRHTSLALIASGAALLAVACGTLSSCMFFRSLDDLSREPRASDAGGATADAALTDGGADAVAPDVLELVSPCDAGTHTLCFDFDHGPLDAGWGGAEATAGCELRLDQRRAASKPSSMLVSLPRRTGTELHAHVDVEIDGAWKHAHLELDAYVEAPMWQADDRVAGLVVLAFHSSTTRTGTVFFTARGAGSVLSIEDAVSPTYFDGPTIPYDRWFHLTLDFRLSGTLTYAVDSVDGARAFSPVTLGSSPAFSLDLGALGFNSPSPPLVVQYDNVVVDLD